MNEQTINDQYDKIIFLLDNRRVADALNAISSFIVDVGDWELRSSFEELQTSYQYMLKYMLDGVLDPSRSKMYSKLVASLYSLADRARIVQKTQISTEYYFDRLRFYSHIPVKTISMLQLEMESYTEEIALKKLINGQIDDIGLTVLRRQHEEASMDLFYRIWISGRWTADDEEEARSLLNSMLVPVNDLSLFISAVTLSQAECFDIRKFLYLLDAYKHDSNLVNQRAIVGIAMIASLYDSRLGLYPEVVARLKLLSEDPAFTANLLTVQIQFLRTRETEKIDKKMREEIIPEMVKNMNRMNKIDLEDADEDSFSENINPDWEDWGGTSGLQDKLKEMSELQMEGADVYMSTFAQLKRYPFFNEMANWFYPFDKQHSAIIRAFGTGGDKQFSILDNLLQSAFFCNSDKYSFCFTIMQVPEAQRSMMAGQLEEQSRAMKDDDKNGLNALMQRLENISNQYIHDLYRFYKVFPRRHEFWSPFVQGIDLYHSKMMKGFTHQPDFMRAQANFLFQKEYFYEAYSIYQDFVDLNGGDAELYQKIGFCLQRCKDYEGAVSAYLDADLQLPDNLWTNHHLATCYRMLNQYDEALEYYLKVELVQTDNLKVMTQIGLCLAKLKRYEEALGYFFKVEYLSGSSLKVWRAIGWSSFLIGKYDQAMKFYEKMLQRKDAKPQDYLNTGHVAWILGDIGKAVRMYESCRKLLTEDDQFLSLFDEDKDILIEKGINGDDIPLMRDLVLFSYRNA